MSHTIQECAYTSSEYFDECEICGDLTACVCLGAIVESWTISRLDFPVSFAPSAKYYFDFTPKQMRGEMWGVADTYREAMDKIAHLAICEIGQGQ
jgi:hypothetical protein